MTLTNTVITNSTGMNGAGSRSIDGGHDPQ
jgi:hypothetical protein